MTSINWQRLGHISIPARVHPWGVSHASVPIMDPIGGDLFRAYFSARDADGRSWTTSCVVDLTDRPRLVETPSVAHLAPGSPGTFDDRGAMACWLDTHSSPRRLYYIGWNTGTTVPFRNAIGVAYEQGDGTWEKAGEGPLLDRSAVDPYFLASCCVLPDGDSWVMWYLSCTAWEPVNGALHHRYLIKRATSLDGIRWERDGHVAIAPANNNEYAISRPSVIRDGNLWHMWYSYRGERYRIGYAQSPDGITWTRHDDVGGLAPLGTGWESEMVEYGHAFMHRGALYMAYNGNRYGADGFGIVRAALPDAITSAALD